MIVLDTNVVSELMRPSPAPAVLAWVDQHPADLLWLTSMTAAELLAGIAVLPNGARRRRLGKHVNTLLTDLFADRILSFDSAAATVYADLLERRQRSGQPISTADAIIAATCLAAGTELLATRNTTDFTGIGLPLADPWLEPTF